MKSRSRLLAISICLLLFGCNVKPGGRSSDISEGHPSYFRVVEQIKMVRTGNTVHVEIPEGSIELGNDGARLSYVVARKSEIDSARTGNAVSREAVRFIVDTELPSNGGAAPRDVHAEDDEVVAISLAGSTAEDVLAPQDAEFVRVLMEPEEGDTPEPPVVKVPVRGSISFRSVPGATVNDNVIVADEFNCQEIGADFVDEAGKPIEGHKLELQYDLFVEGNNENQQTPLETGVYSSLSQCIGRRAEFIARPGQNVGPRISIETGARFRRFISVPINSNDVTVTIRAKIYVDDELNTQRDVKFSVVASETRVAKLAMGLPGSGVTNAGIKDNTCNQLTMYGRRSNDNYAAPLRGKYRIHLLATTGDNGDGEKVNEVKFFRTMEDCLSGADPIKSFLSSGMSNDNRAVFVKYDATVATGTKRKVYIGGVLRRNREIKNKLTRRFEKTFTPVYRQDPKYFIP